VIRTTSQDMGLLNSTFGDEKENVTFQVNGSQ
jgi:hypothetical protein